MKKFLLKLPGMLLPPARRKPRLGEVLPALLFIAAFAITCVAVELLHIATFARPARFGWALVLPWLAWQHLQGWHGLAGWRGPAALLTRLALAAACVAALAEPRAVRSSRDLSVVFALDVSDSIGDSARRKALEFITTSAAGKPESDRVGMVVFGANAAVELPPRQSFPFEVINARVPTDGSDLARALSLSGAVLPEDTAGRVVLISDGAQTSGQVSEAVEQLRSRGIAVDVLPVEYAFGKEVWVEKLELPRNVKIGETYEASVIVSSLTAGAGKLNLSVNGETVSSADITWKPGKNRQTLPLYLPEAGYYEYEATVIPTPGEDGWKENNRAIADLLLKGEGRVLLVTDPDNPTNDADGLVAALRASKHRVETTDSLTLPNDSLALQPYDSIALINVPAESLGAMQQRALRDAVYRQGTGLLMVGGEQSFGPGGYNRTPIEEALPVTMDVKQKKVLPKGALAIILHTCEFAQGNEWGKRIALQAIRVMGAQDDAGVLAFSYSNTGVSEGWIVPLSPVSGYDKMVPKINGAEIGDMPSFEPTMRAAFTALQGSDAAMKHVIIISDGDPSPPPPELVTKYQDAKISVSTVAINPHGGQEVGIMRTIAAQTGGRYYFPQDPAQLPAIFIKEAKTLKRSMIQNKKFVPEVTFPSDILKGFDTIPQLHGYVITMAKPRASVILSTPEEGGERDPVLATWRFGLGKSAAFTTDLTPNWGRDWLAWQNHRSFVEKLFLDIARTRRESHLTVQSFADGPVGVVTIEDNHPEATPLDFAAETVGPGGVRRALNVRQVGPRLYRAEFPLEGRGRYQALIAASAEGRDEQEVSGFAVPYSPEYLKFESDPAALRDIAERTGGRVLTGTEPAAELFPANRSIRRVSRPVFDWFLLALAILLPLDVAVRRVQIDWSVVRTWFRRDKGDSTETLAALRKRKAATGETLKSARTELPPVPVTPAPHRPAAPKPKPPPAPAPAAPPTGDEAKGTLGKLLAAKKSRQNENR